MRLTRTKLAVVATLYVVTWIGCWIKYPKDMHWRAQAEYARAVAVDQRIVAEHPEYAKHLRERPTVFRDGAQAEFRWCVPILPGVLLASSDYVIGPLWGNGGIRLVIYYGFGTIETPGFGWVS